MVFQTLTSWTFMHYRNKSNDNSTQFPTPNQGDLYKQPKHVFKPHHIRIQYHNVMVLPFFGVPVNCFIKNQ